MVKFLFFLLSSMLFAQAVAQTDCSLRKDAEGIKVYSCEVKDSKFRSIKASFTLKGRVSQLVAVMEDVPLYKEWQYHMINPKLVNKNLNEVTYYSEISAPWPVSNRDLVVRLQFRYDSLTKILEVNAIGTPTVLPVVENVIRVPSFKAKWRVHEKAQDQLQVEYELVIDMGGSIPAWLVNMAQAEGPFETFSKLKSRIQLEKYKNK